MGNKSGFDYYNVDTDRYQDIRIKRLKKDFGANGIAIYDYILCEIYRVRGCYLVWDDSTAFDVAEYFGLKETLVNEVVNYCGVVGLFNKALLTSERVITSLSIQSRFTEMCIRSKRKNFKIPEKLAILPEETANPPEESTQSSGSFTQSRVKESKVKESRVEECAPVEKILLKSNLFSQPKIPELEEVVRVFLQMGGTKVMAQKFFDKHSATAWFINSSPIKDFSKLVSGFIVIWKQNEQKNGQSINSTGNKPFSGKNGGFQILADDLGNDLQTVGAGGAAGFGSEI